MKIHLDELNLKKYNLFSGDCNMQSVLFMEYGEEGNILLYNSFDALHTNHLLDYIYNFILATRATNTNIVLSTNRQDVIEAFYEALKQAGEDGQFVRIEIVGEDKKIVDYSLKRLEIAIKENIEVM